MAARVETIDEYLAGIPAPQRALLRRLRAALRRLLPQAEECIKYSIPAYRVDGHILAGFAARAAGGSYYPFSGKTLATLEKEIAGYSHTKSALHFDEPLPVALVRKLVAARRAEIPRRRKASRG